MRTYKFIREAIEAGGCDPEYNWYNEIWSNRVPGSSSSLPLVCSLGHSKDAVHKSGKIRSAGRILTYCGIISSYAYICKLNIKCTILKLSGEFNTQVCLSCALPAPCLNIGRCMEAARSIRVMSSVYVRNSAHKNIYNDFNFSISNRKIGHKMIKVGQTFSSKGVSATRFSELFSFSPRLQIANIANKLTTHIWYVLCYDLHLFQHKLAWKMDNVKWCSSVSS